MAAAAAGLIVVTGCQLPGFSSAGASGPTASGTVTVAAAPGVADAPLYIGIRDGLFRAAGLTVKVVSGTSVPGEVSALRGGSADVIFGDYADMFYAQEQKSAPHLLAVADGYDAAPNVMEILTLPGSGISKPSDLKGKTVGTVQSQGMPTADKHNQALPYSQETLATWSVLTNDNVDPSSITWSGMPAANLIHALKTGQVQAILATEPTIYEAASQLGAVPVLDSCTGATASLPLDGYFTSSAYAAHHADVVTAFRYALDRAQAEAGMAAPLQTALTKSAGLESQTASLVTLGTYPTSLSALNLERVVQLMFNFGALPSYFNVSSIAFK